MFDNQSVQDFTNYFETILQVAWRYEDQSALSRYKSKLTKPIFERIYTANFGILPSSYATMKAQAILAEDYIRTTNRLINDNRNGGRTRSKQFKPEQSNDLGSTKENANKTTDYNKDRKNPNPYPPRGEPRKRGRTQFLDITAEKRSKLREENKCFKCEKAGHLSWNCPDSKAPPPQR